MYTFCLLCTWYANCYSCGRYLAALTYSTCAYKSFYDAMPAVVLVWWYFCGSIHVLFYSTLFFFWRTIICITLYLYMCYMVMSSSPCLSILHAMEALWEMPTCYAYRCLLCIATASLFFVVYITTAWWRSCYSLEYVCSLIIWRIPYIPCMMLEVEVLLEWCCDVCHAWWCPVTPIYRWNASYLHCLMPAFLECFLFLPVIPITCNSLSTTVVGSPSGRVLLLTCLWVEVYLGEMPSLMFF